MNELERSGTQLWRNVADLIAAEIAGGVFKPGQKLYNERTLAERYAVHRHTLRRAIAELANHGLLDVRHGSGTFVQALSIPYRIGAQTRFRQSAADLNREPGGRLLASAVLPAPTIVAEQLGLEPGSVVLRLNILREMDGIPVMLSEHWFDGARFADLASRFEKTQSITASLEELGVTGLHRSSNGLSTRMPTRAETATLLQPPTSPVLLWESLKVDGQGIPVDYGIALLAGDRMQVVFELLYEIDGTAPALSPSSPKPTRGRRRS